jgi:hypothetical protein
MGAQKKRCDDVSSGATRRGCIDLIWETHLPTTRNFFPISSFRIEHSRVGIAESTREDIRSLVVVSLACLVYTAVAAQGNQERTGLHTPRGSGATRTQVGRKKLNGNGRFAGAAISIST